MANSVILTIRSIRNLWSKKCVTSSVTWTHLIYIYIYREREREREREDLDLNQISTQIWAEILWNLHEVNWLQPDTDIYHIWF